MLNKTQKFLTLSPQQKRLIIEAFTLTAFMNFGIRHKPFKNLVKGLDLRSSEWMPPPISKDEKPTAIAIGTAVRAASRHTPWKSTCLVQVLTAQRMLQRRKIPGAFYLGAVTGLADENSTGMAAHAWLKCDQEFITGEQGHQPFAVLSCFSWT